MKKYSLTYFSIITLIVLTTGVTLSAFTDQTSILGASFSVGGSEIKLLKDVAVGTDSENLADQIPGPVFTKISSNWTKDYTVKIYNGSDGNVMLTSNANYLTANDTAELRSIINVEPIEWNDANSNGVVDEAELGNSLGKKTIIKWKTEGFDLGVVSGGGVKGLVLRFSTYSVSSTKQGQSATYDFDFNSITL